MKRPARVQKIRTCYIFLPKFVVQCFNHETFVCLGAVLTYISSKHQSCGGPDANHTLPRTYIMLIKRVYAAATGWTCCWMPDMSDLVSKPQLEKDDKSEKKLHVWLLMQTMKTNVGESCYIWPKMPWLGGRSAMFVHMVFACFDSFYPIGPNSLIWFHGLWAKPPSLDRDVLCWCPLVTLKLHGHVNMSICLSRACLLNGCVCMTGETVQTKLCVNVKSYSLLCWACKGFHNGLLVDMYEDLGVCACIWSQISILKKHRYLPVRVWVRVRAWSSRISFFASCMVWWSVFWNSGQRLRHASSPGWQEIEG